MSEKKPASPSVSGTSDMAFSVDLGDAASAVVDMSVVRRKENRIVYYSDQLTEQSRINDIATEELAVVQRMNMNLERNISKKKNDLEFRKTNLELLKEQYHQADTDHDGAVAKKKTLLSQINRIHQTIKQTFERIDRNIKKHDKDVLSSSEDDDDDNIQDIDDSKQNKRSQHTTDDDEEENAAGAEKYEIMQAIKFLKRKVNKGRFEQTKDSVSKLMLKVQKCDLNSKISDLNDKLDQLKQQFTDYDKRIDEANKIKNQQTFMLQYEQEQTTKAESLADDADRTLNRNRLESFSLEAQLEYLAYKALRKQNMQRSANIKVRRAKLERSNKRREIKQRHGNPEMTPSPNKRILNGRQTGKELLYAAALDKRNRSCSPVRQNPSDKVSCSSRRSRSRSRVERRQIRLEIENDTLDELEANNRQLREKKGVEYKEKIAKINELNQKVSEIALSKDQVCEALSRNAIEKNQVEEMRAKIEKLKNEKEERFKKCQALMHDMTAIERNDAVQSRKVKIEKKQRELNKKKQQIDDLKKKVDFSEERYNMQVEKVGEIDKKIGQFDSQIEKNILNIKDEITNMLNGN